MKQILTLAALVFATACFGQEACPNVHDINSNGTIDIEDFLSILGLFADVDVDEDGVWDSQDDCLDASACNYLASPTEPCGYLDALGECGGACEGDGDGDGICDDVDDCIGVIDECGVCNGPGPTEVVVEDIIILFDSVYAEQIDEWFVFEVGADTTFSYFCASQFESCGDPFAYQGYNYGTVQIGPYCWFTENLRVTSFNNGDDIPVIEDPSAWWELHSPAMIAPNHFEEYGGLYNYYAVESSSGLCPTGWHVSRDNDWEGTSDAFGGEYHAAPFLKSSSWDGNNQSGLTAEPAGYCWQSGVVVGVGTDGFWWSSTPNSWSGEGHCFRMESGWSRVFSLGNAKAGGFGIRCVQDY